MRPEERAKIAPVVRRTVANNRRRAFRWWNSLGQPTLLRLNQSLFTRYECWKEPPDPLELKVCQALCWKWLDLPPAERSAAAARERVSVLLRERLNCFLRGEIDPGVPDTRWDPKP